MLTPGIQGTQGTYKKYIPTSENDMNQLHFMSADTRE